MWIVLDKDFSAPLWRDATAEPFLGGLRMNLKSRAGESAANNCRKSVKAGHGCGLICDWRRIKGALAHQ
ncbi:hypothetical protein O8B93_26135 [Agrobacterium rhizogenes]|uniref:hypothetical protein n=1 Tax=Rhizobium rhizogenes TaxID=359 RepID=UPI0022B75091|nr:hypothetical protein [Rhizobium rhizogenes]MCZ7451052.1 hypothetical protein [Rhizobium rhizogenes]